MPCTDDEVNAVATLRSSPYEVVPVSGNDLPAVLELRSQMLARDPSSSHNDLTRAEWLYAKNPAGVAEILGLRERGGPWVGMVAIVPRRISVDGTVHPGAFLCDFYVHPKHRTLLPALSLQRLAKERLQELNWLNYAIPNQLSLPIFRRLGAQQILQRYRWARPIRTEIFLARRGYRCTRMASSLLDVALHGFDVISSLGSLCIRTEWIERFDDRFEALWSSLPKSGLTIGERSARYLQWRFQEEPGHKNLILSLTDSRSSRLCGYVIGEVVQEEFVVRDYVIAARSSQSVGAFSRILIAIRRLGVAAAAIRIAGPEGFMQPLRRAGFKKRDPETVFVRGLPHNRCGQWLLTSADEDV